MSSSRSNSFFADDSRCYMYSQYPRLAICNSSWDESVRPLPKSTISYRNTFRYNQPVGDIPVVRRCDLIVVTEIL